MSPAASKALYKPLSLAFSVLGGLLAGAVFTKLWSLVGEEEAPDPTALDHRTREVLTVAVLQGAVFGLVKAVVDRAGAKGYHRMTGNNPRR